MLVGGGGGFWAKASGTTITAVAQTVAREYLVRAFI
jgi:hypothetical protein